MRRSPFRASVFVAVALLFCACASRGLQSAPSSSGSGGATGGTGTPPPGTGGTADASITLVADASSGVVADAGAARRFAGGPGDQTAPCATFDDCQCGLLCTGGTCQADPTHAEGSPGAACNRACDCLTGSLCVPNASGTGSWCVPSQQIDAGARPPTCGEYVESDGQSCVAGTSESTGGCRWSVPSSCPLGYICTSNSTNTWCTPETASEGAACETFADCQCGLTCQANRCTGTGGGFEGAICNRACDCNAGLWCTAAATDSTGVTYRCIPSPPPDNGRVPKCGDYVGCDGTAAFSAVYACNPRLALDCPAGSSLDVTGSCMCSDPASCSPGLVCVPVEGGSSYTCAQPSDAGSL
jgi:hypothetical protein